MPKRIRCFRNKPLEDYPKNQLELIANSLKDEAQQSIKSQYDELIKKGDDNLSQKSYKEALDYFDQASEILQMNPIR